MQHEHTYELIALKEKIEMLYSKQTLRPFKKEVKRDNCLCSEGIQKCNNKGIKIRHYAILLVSS